MMNQLDRDAYITIDTKYASYDDVYNCLTGNKINVKSITGLDVATFIISVFDLIVSIVSMPVIQDAFTSGHIIVMIGGVTFNDTVGSIVEAIKKDSKLCDAAKAAYNDDAIKIEGKAKAVQSFRAALLSLIDNMEENQ